MIRIRIWVILKGLGTFTFMSLLIRVLRGMIREIGQIWSRTKHTEAAALPLRARRGP